MASSPRLNTISRKASARGHGQGPEDYSRMPIGDDRPGRRAQACVFAFPLLLLVGLAFRCGRRGPDSLRGRGRLDPSPMRK